MELTGQILQSNFTENATSYAILVIVLILLYNYLTLNFDYWNKQGLKTAETPLPLLGNVRPFTKERLEVTDWKNCLNFGITHGGFEGSMPVLYTIDPDNLKVILVKDFNNFTDRRHMAFFENDVVLGNMLIQLKGNDWRAIRNVISKTFSSGKLKQMVFMIEDSITSTMKTVDKLNVGEPLDVRKYFSAFTLDVIASCAFGLKLNIPENPESDFVKNARLVFQNSTLAVYLVILFPRLFRTIKKWLPLNHFKFFAEIAEKAIDLRLKDNIPRKDLLSMMIESEREERAKSDFIQSTNILKRDIIVSQAVLFLMAGHETPATTLSLIAYYLAFNQEEQNKLIKEIDETLKENDGKFPYDVVVSMPYLDMVVSEVLRLFPPAVRLERTVTEDCELDGIKLCKGMLIVSSLYALHRIEKYYPDPDKFDPERFTAEEKAKRHPFVYLPFGAGPRNCVAMRFALIVVKIGLLNIMAKYRFLPCDKTDVPLKMASGPGVSTPLSVHLILEDRHRK